MKKIFLIASTSIAFGIFFTSCKKQLELTPSDAIDVSKAFTSVTDLEKGLLGVYSADNQTNKIYIGSIIADETKISDENRGQGQFSFKFQYSGSEGEHNSDYALYYAMLDRLHRVLAAFDNVKAANTSESDKKSKLKSELLALRGVAYYELLIRFMPSGYDPNALAVPIILSSDITAKPARNKVSEVVAQIETDLAAARTDATLQSAPTDPIRISKAAIAAYQARVALLKRDYPSAIQFATDAITFSGKTLAANAAYVAYWQDANENETIWKYRNSTAPQLLWRDSNGDVFFEPANKLKNQYNRATDVRYNTFFSKAITGGQNDTSIVNKYPGSALGPQINDIKIVRISEMYLLRAEARAENNDLTGSAADINLVRAARISPYTNVTFATKDIAVTEILNERYKELCFEGFRFFDLKRKGLAVNRAANDVSSTNWQNLNAGDFHFALPLPSDELLANPNAVQNPGY